MPADPHSRLPGRLGFDGLGQSAPSGSGPVRPRLRGSVVVIALACAAALGAWIWKESNPDTDLRVPQWAQPVLELFQPAKAEATATPDGLIQLPDNAPPADGPSESEDDGLTGQERQKRLAEALEQGQLYSAIERHDLAAKHYAEAVKLDPDNALARYKLALSCVHNGRYAAARHHKAALEELSPDLANLLGDLVR